MTQIILNKCDDGAIWVTSDEDELGSESAFSGIPEENYQFLIALCDFVGMTPI